MTLKLLEEWALPEGRFVLTKHLSGERLLFRNLTTDLDVILARGAFDDLHAAGEATRIRRGHGRAARYDEQDEVPPEGATDEALARRFYCRKWDEAPCAKSEVALARLVAHHAPEARRRGILWEPSPGALARALRHRGEIGRRPLRVMGSLRGKTSRQRWPAAVAEAMRRSVLWYFAHRPRTQGDAYGYLVKFLRTANRFGEHLGPGTWKRLPIPSDETLRTRILREESLENLTEKFGPVEARRRLKGTVGALQAEAILDYVLIDSTVIDGWCVLDDHRGMLIPAGRPTLTIAIDLRSRTILAVVLTYEPPSLYTIMSCLQLLMTKKNRLTSEFPEFSELWAEKWGKPETILVDNEWAQVGISFQEACEDAGISVEWAPVKNPEYKAYVERFFHTLNRKLFHRVAGGVPFPANVMRKLDLRPDKDAVIGRLELEGLIYQTLRDAYQYEVHAGTGFAPETLWRQGIAKGREYVDDVGFLASAFGVVREATLTRSGIRLKGMNFHHTDVTTDLLRDLAHATPVRQRPRGGATARVRIKYNPADASGIEVWNSGAKPRKKYVRLPNVDEAYVAGGLGFWHHKMVKAFAEHEALAFGTDAERVVARDRLRAAVENAAPDMKMAAMRRYRRLRDPARPVLSGDIVDAGTIRPVALSPGPADIPVVVAAQERVGNGLPGKDVRRGGAKATRKSIATRSRNAARADAAVPVPALPVPAASGAGAELIVQDPSAYYREFERRMAEINKSTRSEP